MKVNLYEMMKLDTLRHRETAQKVIDLISEIPSDETIVIDFSGIIFASRSFCHELQKGLEGRRIDLKNMSTEVSEMMQLVKVKPRIEPRKSFNHKKLELVAG